MWGEIVSKMTPEEKANKIFAGLTTINEHFGYKFTQPLMNAIDNTALALKEAGPREVSETEIDELAMQFCENEAPKTDSISLRQARANGYRAGLQKAARLNAIAKLESLWPSEVSEHDLHLAALEPYPDSELGDLQYDAFIEGARWVMRLKAPALGGGK